MFVDTYRKNSDKKICLELNNLVKYVMIIFYVYLNNWSQSLWKLVFSEFVYTAIKCSALYDLHSN